MHVFLNVKVVILSLLRRTPTTFLAVCILVVLNIDFVKIDIRNKSFVLIVALIYSYIVLYLR